MSQFALPIAVLLVLSAVRTTVHAADLKCPLRSGDIFQDARPIDTEVREDILTAIGRRLGIDADAVRARLNYAGTLAELDRHFPRTVLSSSSELSGGVSARNTVRILRGHHPFLADSPTLRQRLIPSFAPVPGVPEKVLQGVLDYAGELKQVTCLQLDPRAGGAACRDSNQMRSKRPFDLPGAPEQLLPHPSKSGVGKRSKLFMGPEYVCHVSANAF